MDPFLSGLMAGQNIVARPFQMAQQRKARQQQMQLAQQQAQSQDALRQAQAQYYDQHGQYYQNRGQQGTTGSPTGTAGQIAYLNNLIANDPNNPAIPMLRQAIQSDIAEKSARAKYFQNPMRSAPKLTKEQIIQNYEQQGLTPQQAILRAQQAETANVGMMPQQGQASGQLSSLMPQQQPQQQPQIGANPANQQAAQQAADQTASSILKQTSSPAQLQQITRFKNAQQVYNEMADLAPSVAQYANATGKFNRLGTKVLGSIGLTQGSQAYNNLIQYKRLGDQLANELSAANLSPKVEASVQEWHNYVNSPDATTPQEFITAFNNLGKALEEQSKSAATGLASAQRDVQNYQAPQASLPSNTMNQLPAIQQPPPTPAGSVLMTKGGVFYHIPAGAQKKAQQLGYQLYG